jgi:DNA-binding response OmpR family regulator
MITSVNSASAAPPHQLTTSSWQQLLFAPEEGEGAQPQPEEPDRVLVIEDDALIASQMQTALDEAGFQVVGVAATGEEALQFASRQSPALAIVDIRLAGDRDGVDTALELLRSHGVRCIFASAYADRETRRRADAAAPLGWLQKPFTMGSLTAMVRRAAAELRDKS